ncbi:MAG: hypothetical protein DRP79_02570 [Planctomycetota bacterium]|nr:MAG: hypothetical protein DRP79_02570 [Planctomycetota bacterium]
MLSLIPVFELDCILFPGEITLSPYRLVAIDVDGTLHTSERTVPPEVPPYLRKLEERGVMVALCTGRRYRVTLPILREVGVRSPMVLHSGALVRNPLDHTTIFRRYLPPDLARTVVAVMKARERHPIMWIDEYDAGIDMVSTRAARETIEEKYLARHGEYVRLVDDLEEFESDRIFAVCSWGDFDELANVGEAVSAALGDKVHYHVAKRIIEENSILEVFEGSVSKWNALSMLAGMHGIPREGIAAIGDNYNDVEMVRKAGLGIAMGNAVPELKAVADYVTVSNDENGLLRALQRFFQ